MGFKRGQHPSKSPSGMEEEVQEGKKANMNMKMMSLYLQIIFLN
jgi:hypothetical protein